MVKLSEVSEALHKLAPSKIAIGFGAGLAITPWFVLENRDDQLFLFVTGMVVFGVGLLMAINKAKAMERMKLLDLEHRRDLMDRGLPPENDKTIIKMD